MAESTNVEENRGVCHLQWYINSQCDYACARCVPDPSAQGKTDLPLDARIEALHSFADFASARNNVAHITLYPRQARFTESTTDVFSAIRGLKTAGLLQKVICANRGDLPDEKIELYGDAGVDECRLTIDGPEPVQNTLRRTGSFVDTLKAFHETRKRGINVIPLVILGKYNAPYLVDTMKMFLNEGFENFTLQVGIRSGDEDQATDGIDFSDTLRLWNQWLSAGEYRSVLLNILSFLDSDGGYQDLRKRLVPETPMFGRLFFELGRGDEYERLAGHVSSESTLEFALQPDGSVHYKPHMPAIGAFPGGSFDQIYASAHPMRRFESQADRQQYEAGELHRFAKCGPCPAAGHCKPTLTAERDGKLVYSPDDHCWVSEGEEGCYAPRG